MDSEDWDGLTVHTHEGAVLGALATEWDRKAASPFTPFHDRPWCAGARIVYCWAPPGESAGHMACAGVPLQVV